MRVFQFNYDGVYTAICSTDLQLAINYFKEIVADEYSSILEIDESEWDIKRITKFSKNKADSFKVSIREAIGNKTGIVFTNDDVLTSN